MQRVQSPRKTERRVGVLEIALTKKDKEASVRLDDNLLLILPLNTRGVLQQDGKTIVLCANGDRYAPLQAGAKISLDLVYDAEGKNPFPGLWAPKQKPPQQ